MYHSVCLRVSGRSSTRKDENKVNKDTNEIVTDKKGTLPLPAILPVVFVFLKVVFKRLLLVSPHLLLLLRKPATRGADGIGWAQQQQRMWFPQQQQQMWAHQQQSCPLFQCTIFRSSAHFTPVLQKVIYYFCYFSMPAHRGVKKVVSYSREVKKVVQYRETF